MTAMPTMTSEDSTVPTLDECAVVAADWSSLQNGHKKLLDNLFDLAHESELDLRALQLSAGGCIALARRGDSRPPVEGWGFATTKFVSSGWGTHPQAHAAMAM